MVGPITNVQFIASKRYGLVETYDQLAHEKIMEFLENNAKVETAPAVEGEQS